MNIPFDPGEKRRYGTPEIKKIIRRKFNAELVDGLSAPAGSGRRSDHQRWPIASFINVYEAWKIDQWDKPFFSWLTENVPEDPGERDIVFVFPMATGYGAGYPEPSGWFEFFVNGKPAVKFRETKYTDVWRLGECALCFDVMRCDCAADGQGLEVDPWIKGSRMASYGVALLKVPGKMVKPGRKVRIDIKAEHYFPSHTWVRIDRIFKKGQRNESNLTRLVWEPGLDKLLNKKKHLEISGKQVFFGDIHAHSFCGLQSPCGEWKSQSRDSCYGCELDGKGNGCGWATVNGNYLYARDVANLDFFTLTEHDFQMPGDLWSRRVKMANRYTDPGFFVAVNGYEYTSWLYGHRNVYFLDDHPPMFPSSPNPGKYANEPQTPPEELWKFLESNSEDFFTVPHHPTAADHPFCWDRYNSWYDQNVEIFSGWGSSETADTPLTGDGANKYPHLSIRAALSRGLKFGFVSGSDSHDGCPGNAQGIPLYNWANKFSKVGSGRTAVICNHLTRREVYSALKTHTCYATTGAPIVVGFSINGKPMGSMVRIRGNREIKVSIQAPSRIRLLELIKNGIPILREYCESRSEEFSYIDEGTRDSDSYYLKVVLKDMETAWTSPVFVERKT
ncbi:MAG: DUF3604 domain-containing protein [Spirochaetes bacterium]|nr:DUF3604 domain-containing protein [Spirochaetota bacterium]